MRDHRVMRAAGTALFAFCFAWFGFAGAQSATPAPTPENTSPAAQAQRQSTQPFNNAPIWREVRSGAPQTTTVVGRETNVLIQPQGETWRAIRNGQVAVYGGWALVVMLLAIAAFYWIKGPIELHEKATGRKILRFNALDRAVHWATAISFVILAVSGLIMFFGKGLLLPLIGYTLFSWVATLSKNLHNFVGPLFAVCTIVMLVHFVKDNLPARGDWEWLRRFGGVFSEHEVPSGKLNALEKLWFWGGACVLGIIVSAAGFVLDFPNFDQTRQTMQLAHIVHSVGALLFMLGALGHIYIGTIGMTGAYEGMRHGYVDEEWAKEHHKFWYDEVKAGRTAASETGRPAVTRHRAA
jgi:formate dehydrogenase subunit gamma